MMSDGPNNQLVHGRVGRIELKKSERIQICLVVG